MFELNNLCVLLFSILSIITDSTIFFSGNVSPKQSSLIFPEFELLTEPEPLNAKDEDVSQEKHTLLPSTTDNSYPDTEGKFAEISDKQFEKFKTIIKREPEQVRCLVKSRPLWTCYK